MTRPLSVSILVRRQRTNLDLSIMRVLNLNEDLNKALNEDPTPILSTHSTMLVLFPERFLSIDIESSACLVKAVWVRCIELTILSWPNPSL